MWWIIVIAVLVLVVVLYIVFKDKNKDEEIAVAAELAAKEAAEEAAQESERIVKIHANEIIAAEVAKKVHHVVAIAVKKSHHKLHKKGQKRQY